MGRGRGSIICVGPPLFLLLVLASSLWLIQCAVSAPLSREQPLIDDVFLPFSGAEVVDETSVLVGIGRPVQTYRLQLIFSNALYEQEAGGSARGHIVLTSSDRLMTSSATYQHIVPGQLGRDIVELGSVRWVALIETRPSTTPPPSSLPPGIDGLLYLGHYEAPAPGNYWQAVEINRLGVTWFSSAEQHRAASWSTRPHQITQLVHSTGDPIIGIVENVTVAGYGSPTTTPFRLLIAPDRHTTSIPRELFQWYFAGKNLYSDHPSQWPPLVLQLPHGFSISLNGDSILPLSEGEPSASAGTSSDGSGNTASLTELSATHTLRILISELDTIEMDWRHLQHLLEALASSGFNTLKLIPHLSDEQYDNHTIVLGGHLLWSAASIGVDYSNPGGPEVWLLSHPTGGSLTYAQGILVIAAIILYIRWKLGSLWIDYAVTHDGWIRHYYFIISADAVLWPFVLPLWAAPLASWYFWSWITSTQTVADARAVAVTLILSWIVTLATAGVVAWRSSRGLLQRWRRVWRHFTVSPRRWFRKWARGTIDAYLQSDDKPRAIVRSQPSITPHPVRLKNWYATPSYEMECPDNAGHFFWIPVALLTLRDSAINTLSALTLWCALAPIDTPLFAMITGLVIMLAMACSGLVHLLNLCYLTFWPLLSRHRARSVRPVLAQVLLLLATLGFSINDFYLLMKISFMPAVLTSSVLYGNNDETVFVLSGLFVITTLFVLVRFSHSFLLSLFLPRGEEGEGRTGTNPKLKD